MHPRPTVAFLSALVAGVLLAPAEADAEAATAAGPDRSSAARGGDQRPSLRPERLPGVGAAEQVVLVTATSWSTSTATLEAWGRTSTGWRRVVPPVRARLGSRGFARHRRQNSGETPSGSFRLVSAFGSGGNPGTRLPWRRFSSGDWWVYDPRDAATYNTWQSGRAAGARWRTAWAEHLIGYRGQYRWAVVIDYNLPRSMGGTARTPSLTAGGGIFLHVDGDGATAGCVSVPAGTMRRLLRWLRPSAAPRIIMGPVVALRG